MADDRAADPTEPLVVPEVAPRTSFYGRTRRYWIFFLLLMMCNEIWDTYNTTYPDIIVSLVIDEFGITRAEYLFYLGVFSLGTLFVFFSQVLVDVVGRRPMLFLIFLGYGVVNLVLNFVASVQEYTAAMFFLYMCFSSDVWTIMISEEAPPDKRGRYVSLVLVVGASAALPISLAEAYLVPMFGWRAMTWFGMIPLGLAFVMLALKETPAFLELKEKQRRGGPSSARDASEGPDSPPAFKVSTGPEASTAPAFPAEPETSAEPEGPTPAEATAPAPRPGYFARLKLPFQSEYLKPFLVILASGFVLGMNYMFIKTGEEFLTNTKGFTTDDIAVVVILIPAAAILGFVITGLLSDKIGRKNTLYLFSALLPTGLLLFVFGTKALTYLGILFAWMAFWSLGIICRLVCLEIFPSEIRGLGTGWRTLLFALGTTLGAFLGSGLEPLVGLEGIYFIYAFCFVGVVPFFAIAIKETMGVSLTRDA